MTATQFGLLPPFFPTDPINYLTFQYLRLAGLKVYLPLFPQIYYGDKIIVEGKVISGKLENPKLVGKVNQVSILSAYRNSIISFYQKVLPEPEGELLGGIVLGSKGALTSDFYNQTKLVGVAYVVVASGTNVTFVVSFLMGVLILILSRREAIPFVVFGIILILFYIRV